MTKARDQQICLHATPYYHCVSRCVRRAFLCGKDKVSGQSYEHRRQWLEDRILALAKVFSIDICAYAVMSNHYHVVLCVDREKALGWGEQEVVERWHCLYKGNLLSQRFIKGETLSRAELAVLRPIIQNWRERLYSISQFMQLVNEGIARQANAEDKCSGRFWEGRYKSQALLDDAALMACMAYVDLNPVRVNMAKTPETSEHTSVKRRAACAQRAVKKCTARSNKKQPSELLAFVGNPRQTMPRGLPFKLNDYLLLLDWTGRQLRKSKRGVIDANIPPILRRLGIDRQSWLLCSCEFEVRFKGLIGRAEKLSGVCEQFGRKHASGIKSCKALLGA
ncbi:transposase [Agaribacterium haliotis]|uniref:transposase n=1 Tax=Agaribacterium haliotis TaxID=2013869 RepID=UPI000BB5524D|nr:transposase [Agaribacterium haliotis]